eukprot:12932-Heterococcus_DN1.PRE.1
MTRRSADGRANHSLKQRLPGPERVLSYSPNTEKPCSRRCSSMHYSKVQQHNILLQSSVH